MSKSGPTIMVFADSLAFHGPVGPEPADEPRLWPNIAAAAVGGRARLFAGFGWTARDAWWSMVGDPNVWAVMPEVDVLVLAVGSMDTLPSPLPTYLRSGLRYLRPDGLRRRARDAYRAALPTLSRLSRGRPVALPSAQTVRYLDDCLRGVRSLKPGLPVIGVLPGVHRAREYGFVHTGYRPAVAAISAWGARRAVPLLDLAALTGEHVLAGEGNPDGMHWGWAGHAAMGHALAKTVTELGLAARHD
ncbi:MAG TPA: diglucosylglycerate octanoyltransferase [Pseudonocardiaceae bacterium]|nr:diglucosylglycerate octanoyltransferase [Pseudonocardiaceae bacterium]